MNEILELAKRAALKGAEVAGWHFERLASLQFESKDTGKGALGDIVSLADAEVEAAIRDVIRAARPNDAVLGEETGLSEGAGLLWIVDPIDGTMNFSYHRNEFAVSIAACDAKGALVAVVASVLPARVFSAIRGAGAWCDGESITPRACTTLQAALVDVGRGRNEVRSRFVDVIAALDENARDIRRSGGAALAACQVACGELDAMYGAGLEQWDIAAGALIAREAGAVVDEVRDDVVLISSSGVAEEFGELIRSVIEGTS
jgi:myo-inositol-1(or 4)-monophosphatase